MRNSIYSFIFLVIFFSCAEKEGGHSEINNLPPSSGAVGEVLLVMDTSHITTVLGTTLKDIFLSPYPGLPQAETDFKTIKINYDAFATLFKKSKTIIFTIPFNDGESKGFIKKMIGSDIVDKIVSNNKPYLIKEDVFAKNQQIVFIFGNTVEDVSQNLKNNAESIIDKINQKEQKILTSKLYKIGEKKKLEHKLKDELGVRIRIPKDYKLVKGTKDCLWLRKALEETDFNIMITSKAYTSRNQFDSVNVSQMRNELAANVDGGDSNSIKLVQGIFPIERRIFDNPYKVEERGLWKLKNNTMGGPFISEVRLSDDNSKIYYIEGFIVAPGKKKRPLVRELESIFSTISL